MTKANAEAIIVNNDIKVEGFMFSPDFDTSQQINISNFVRNLRQGQYKAVSETFKMNGINVPVLLLGKHADNKEQIKFATKCYKYLWERQYNRNTDSSNLKKNTFCISCEQVKFNDGQTYLIQESDQFFCLVYDENLIIFIANPFPCIFKEEEVLQHKGYRKNCGIRLKGYQRYIDSYNKDIKRRQSMFRKDMQTMFEHFAAPDAFSKFVIGAGHFFLNNGYILLLGNENDHKICYQKDVFPYGVKDNKLVRKTDNEIKQIIAERDEYERKCDIVNKRIDAIEKLLHENELTYTVISRGNIKFEDDGTWKTWMNAQVYDDANFGWFCENDFLDWLNCKGKIPFKRGNARRLAKILQNLSNDQFKLICVVPKNKGKYSNYDDYDVVVKFEYNNTELVLEVDDIRKKIEAFGGMKVYEISDIEKSLPKPTLKEKIKNIFLKKAPSC